MTHPHIRSACTIADFTAFFVSSVILTRGNLTSSEHKFNRLAAYLTGDGLLSINSDLCRGINFSLISFALESRLLLFFAGEATSVKIAGYLQMALQSGLREAENIKKNLP